MHRSALAGDTIHVHLGPAPLLVAGIVAVALLLLCATVAAHWALRRRKGLPTRPRHIAQRAYVHLPLPLAALLLGFATVGAGVTLTYVINGAQFNPHQHVAPPLAIVRAGAAAPASVDLLSYAQATNQLGWNDCGPVTLAKILYDVLRARGEHPPTFSYAYVYLHTPGGPSNGYTTMAEVVDSENTYGIVAYADQPQPDSPSDGGRVYYLGLTLHTLFYAPDGWAGLDAIKAAEASGHYVAVLADWRTGMTEGYSGASIISNTGDHVGYHFMPSHGYDQTGLYLLQSYGLGYGNQGRFTLTWDSALDTIMAAYTIDVAPDRYFAPAPTATATPRPTALPTATATPRPTVRPTATPTATPRPSVSRTVKHGPIYVLVRAMYLRPTPATDPTSHVLVPVGAHVRLWGRQPGDRRWLHCTWHGSDGYLLRANVT